MASLQVFEDHIHMNLFVHKNDLVKICGIPFPDRSNSKIISETIQKNHSQILNHFINHISIYEKNKKLNTHFNSFLPLSPFYITFQIDFKFSKSFESNSFSFTYQFENFFDQRDHLALIVEDKRNKNNEKQTILLHGTRKLVRWTPDSLRSEIITPYKSSFLNISFLFMLLSFIFIMFVPVMIKHLYKLKPENEKFIRDYPA